ncbi:hypothetical protein F4821DRAFT_263974 [Hypoxylon rubiginosum]|uniref:Uncharacterized protein n=1 Tax=Hypoxylon rubiginosum TaxID=110542 RepID=A0ACC0CPR8_9PEZI|nr:hypothetical protein F4821DRAFT_263974 [Hypoxylon rubiginosum]
MLRNFAFADSDASPDDDDPLPVPGNLIDQPSFQAMTTSGSSKQDAARADHLDRNTGEQTFIQTSQSSLLLEAQNKEIELNLPTGPSQDPAPIHTPIQPTSIPSIELDPKQPVEPIIANPQPQFQPREQRHESTESLSDDLSDDLNPDNVHLRIRKRKGLWRPNKKSSRSSSPAKPRKPDLLANMIESGDQCNVHSTVPEPSTTGSKPLPPFLIDLMASAKFDDNMNPQFMDDDMMELEVDKDHCAGKDGAAGPSGPTSLRDAGGPAGIKKLSSLRYRTSSEAASRCKNMRRSLPRMRRRPKSDQSDAASSRPESRASTSTTPL